MSNSYRWLSVPPLAGLEGQGCGSLGGGSSPAGVSYSLCQGSSTVSGTHPHVHQGGCSGGGHSGPHFQGSSRTGSFAFSGLLQPSLCGVASSHRPLISIAFWLPLPSRWSPSSLSFSRFIQGIGWCPTT